jgi:SSS family solute:Na+ symporter
MWIANLSYWGFNQYIIQRALAAKSIDEAQRGVLFAAFLKLIMPLIIVVPGIAAVLIAPGLPKPDEAYPSMMRLLPTGLLGLVFAALIAAIIASTASKINSIATIFTLDVYAKFKGERTAVEDGGNEHGGRERHLVLVGRVAAAIAIVIAILMARPLLGKSDQAFQFIQEFTGFFTPGITVIFLLGLFWKRANEAGAIAAAVTSVGLSWLFKVEWAGLPFMDRMGVVFVIAAVLAILVSLLTPQRRGTDTIKTGDVVYTTRAGFNAGALAVVLILVALYATWW